MAFDAKRSVYEIAVEVGGKAKPTLRKATDETVQQVGRMQKSVERLEKSSAKTSTAMSKLWALGKAGVAFAVGSKITQGFVSVAKSAINAASEMETYRTTLNTVLRDEDAAADMMRWATDFAAHTPYNTGEVVEAVTKMEAYGFKSQVMLENIGNMASAMNKDLTTAVEAVYKASIGDMELMRNNFAITKEIINDKAEELYGKSVINASGAITDAEAYNNAMLRLIEEKFAGGMEKQSKTMAGIKSNIEDSWEAALRKISGMDAAGEIVEGSLYDRIRTKLSGFAGRFDDFVEGDTLSNWGGNLVGIFDEIGNLVSPIVGEGIPGLLSGLGRIYKDFDALVGIVDGIVAKIYGEGILQLITDGIAISLSGIGQQVNAVHNLIVETMGLIETGDGGETVKTAEEIAQDQLDAERNKRNTIADVILPAWLWGEGVNQWLRNVLEPKGEGTLTHKMRVYNAESQKKFLEAGGLMGSNITTAQPFSAGASSPVSVEVNVTAEPGQDAASLGDTIGERVAEAIREAERQKSRLQLIKE